MTETQTAYPTGRTDYAFPADNDPAAYPDPKRNEYRQKRLKEALAIMWLAKEGHADSEPSPEWRETEYQALERALDDAVVGKVAPTPMGRLRVRALNIVGAIQAERG